MYFHYFTLALQSSYDEICLRKLAPGAVSLMHRPFKIIFNDDELDLAGDSLIIVMFWQDVWPKLFYTLR